MFIRYFYVSIGARLLDRSAVSSAVISTRSRFPTIEEVLIGMEDAGYTQAQIFCIHRISKKSAKWMRDYIQRGHEESKAKAKKPKESDNAEH